MVRQIAGIFCASAGIAGSLIFFWAALTTDSAVIELVEKYGEKESAFDWYAHPPARDVFHKDLPVRSSIIYFGSGFTFLIILVSVLGLVSGYKGPRKPLQMANILLGISAIIIVVAVWVLFSDSMEIISAVVE